MNAIKSVDKAVQELYSVDIHYKLRHMNPCDYCCSRTELDTVIWHKNQKVRNIESAIHPSTYNFEHPAPYRDPISVELNR